MLFQDVSVCFSVYFLMGIYKTPCNILQKQSLHLPGLEMCEKILQNICILIKNADFQAQPVCDCVIENHILGVPGGGCH